MADNKGYTFNHSSAKRIARTVKWVEDFQLDEGEHTPTAQTEPAYENPMTAPPGEEETAPTTRIRIIKDVQLDGNGLTCFYQWVSMPVAEFEGIGQFSIGVTQCE